MWRLPLAISRIVSRNWILCEAAFTLGRTSCFDQGCGAGTQISGSGSSSGHLIFLAPAPTFWTFWLRFRLQNNLVQKTEKTLYYMYNSLEPEPKFQAPSPVHSSKNFWLRIRLQQSKIAWAPAPQSWFWWIHSWKSNWCHNKKNDDSKEN